MSCLPKYRIYIGLLAQFCKCKMPASDLKAYTLFLQYSLFLCIPNPNPILIQPLFALRFFDSFPRPLFLHSHLKSTNAATKTPPPEPKKTPLTPPAAAQTPCSNANSKQPVKKHKVRRKISYRTGERMKTVRATRGINSQLFQY